ncbi:MAG: YIP1 family protein [Paracoccaceae bacterium]
MNANMMRDLAIATLTTPAVAAGQLLSMRIPRAFLWMSLALMAILNAVAYGFAIVINPPLQGQTVFLPSPFAYAVIAGCGLFALVWAVFKVGQWMGGSGSIDDVLVLVCWMQFLRVIAQFATTVLLMVSSALSLLASMAIFVIGFWISLHFINEGHRLGSLGKAAGVLIGAGLVTAMGVSVLLSLVAAPFIGALGNV